MAYIKELEEKIKDYLKGDYEIIETSTIPSPENSHTLYLLQLYCDCFQQGKVRSIA